MLHKASSQERSSVKTQQKWLINQHLQNKDDQPTSEFPAAKINFRQSTDAMNEKRTGTSMFTTRFSKVLHQSIQLNSEPGHQMHATTTSQSMPFPKSSSLQYSQQQKKTLSKKLQARIGQFTANNTHEKPFETSDLTARSSRLGGHEISHSLEAEIAMREQHDKQALYSFLRKFTGQYENGASGEQDINNQVASREVPALLSSVHALSQKTNAPVIRQLPTRLYKGIISSMKRKRLNKLNPSRFGSSGAESQRASLHDEYQGEDNMNCFANNNETTSPFFGQLNQYSPDLLQKPQYGDDEPVVQNALEQMRQNSKLLYTDLSQHNPKHGKKLPSKEPEPCQNTNEQSLEDLEERFLQECDDLMGSISADPHHTIPELDSGPNSQSWLSSLSKRQDTVYKASSSKASKEEIADKVLGIGGDSATELQQPWESVAAKSNTSKLSFTQAWVQQPAQVAMARLFDSNQMTPALHHSLVFNSDQQLPEGIQLINNATNAMLTDAHPNPNLAPPQLRSTVQGFNASMQVRNSMRVKGLALPASDHPHHTLKSTDLHRNTATAAVGGPAVAISSTIVSGSNANSKSMGSGSTSEGGTVTAALSHRRFNSNPYSSTSPRRGKALNQNSFQAGSSSKVSGYTRQSKLPLPSNYKTQKTTAAAQNPFSISITSSTVAQQHQHHQRSQFHHEPKGSNQVVAPTSSQLLEYYRRNHETAKKMINSTQSSSNCSANNRTATSAAPNTEPQTSRQHPNQNAVTAGTRQTSQQPKSPQTTLKSSSQQQNQFPTQQQLNKKTTAPTVATKTNVTVSQQLYNLSNSTGAQSPPIIQ